MPNWLHPNKVNIRDLLITSTGTQMCVCQRDRKRNKEIPNGTAISIYSVTFQFSIKPDAPGWATRV